MWIATIINEGVLVKWYFKRWKYVNIYLPDSKQTKQNHCHKKTRKHLLKRLVQRENSKVRLLYLCIWGLPPKYNVILFMAFDSEILIKPKGFIPLFCFVYFGPVLTLVLFMET